MNTNVGDVLLDNDPRTGGTRRLHVIGFDLGDTHALCLRDPNSKRTPLRVRLDRIHNDGKKRRTGFDLVRP